MKRIFLLMAFVLLACNIAYAGIDPHGGSVTIAQDLTIADGIDVGGNANIDGTLYVGGNADIVGDLSVRGTVSGAWVRSNALVLENKEPAAIETWYDLTLADYIGVGEALCFFQTAPAEALNLYVHVRENGDTSAVSTGTRKSLHGCATGASIGDIGTFLVWTDANGMIEWRQESAPVIMDLTLSGYIKG